MLLWIITAVAVVALDQFTKYLAVVFLKPVGSFPLILNVLHLTYVENTGAAFGMLKNHRPLFMVVSCAAIVGMILYLIFSHNSSKLFMVSMGMIIGGGIGNMINRFAEGYVVDFIDFTLIKFAVFNGADSFINIGTFLLFVYIVLLERKSLKEQKNAGIAAGNGSGIK